MKMVLNIWTGAIDSDTDEDGNWHLGHKPAANEDVEIPVTDNDPITTGDFTIDGGLEIAIGAKFTVTSGDTLTFTEDNKQVVILGYLKLEDSAIIDCNSLADLTFDISGYVEGYNCQIINMNNATPMDIEGAWIEMWDPTIACDVAWRFVGAARCINLIGDITITNYDTPTLTSEDDVISFTKKYSDLEMDEGDVDASADIVQEVGKSIKVGEKPKTVTIMGACIDSSWDKITEFRKWSRKQYDGTYKKVTFMCGDQPEFAVSGYLKFPRRSLRGPLYPKYYELIIVESRF